MRSFNLQSQRIDLNMMPLLKIPLLLFVVAFFGRSAAPQYTETEVTYARYDGMALQLTVIKPAKPNGKGIVSLLSGGYRSEYAWYPLYRDRALPFVQAGYTVFLVQHGAPPRYTVPDAFAHVQRAIRFVRFHAQDYGIDPDKLGITGTSSGGHLALLAALADDMPDAKAQDPIDRVSSRIQAAAVFCPPTDFLNYGSSGHSIRQEKALLQNLELHTSFRYQLYDTLTQEFTTLDTKATRIMDSLLSPAQRVDAADPPVYIAHGTADEVVPVQQSESVIAKLKAAKVPAVLAKKQGAQHVWKTMNQEEDAFVAWFDQHLFPSKKQTP